MNTETFAFQAEISQLMSLIINTFYSNKNIFLRELISNSSDALDKIRYNSLTNISVLESNNKLEISIIPNKENNTLTIIDTGIGMTKSDMVNNLGTIAKSGTKSFMQALASGADISMIGQFGVGFYSAFLIANTVEVSSKHNDDECYTWRSNANGSFTITNESLVDDLTRGTAIILHLKEDQLDYLEYNVLKDIIKTHSEFINYPIFLQVEKEREIEIEDADNADNSDNADNANNVEGDVKIEELEDNVYESSPKKTITEKYNEMEYLNKTKPIWTRHNKDITVEEYNDFYKGITCDWDEPLYYKHFKVEGQIDFTSIIYLGKRPPFDLFENKKLSNMKLYVKRVFISDDCDELIPSWLNFVKGIVDSEDLPLNISREVLQQNRIIRVIKKNITKKCIEMFEEIMDNSSISETFYDNFSKHIKLGVHEDKNNRERLSHLLRYKTNKSGEELISFRDYITRMKDEQKDIYYITGEMNSNLPFIETLTKRGFEVLFMSDPIDEYIMENLNNIDDKMFVCVTKNNFELPLTDYEKGRIEQIKKEYEPVCTKIKEILGGDRCENVVISRRLIDSPCCIITSQFGWSANMERLMKAQALKDANQMTYMMGKKIFEINPSHRLINELKNKLNDEEQKVVCYNLINLLYDTALLESGFTLDNISLFSTRIYNIIEVGLGIEESNVKDSDNASEKDLPCSNSFVSNESLSDNSDKMEDVD
jgi:molecular chaperone HtpG